MMGQFKIYYCCQVTLNIQVSWWCVYRYAPIFVCKVLTFLPWMLNWLMWTNGTHVNAVTQSFGDALTTQRERPLCAASWKVMPANDNALWDIWTMGMIYSTAEIRMSHSMYMWLMENSAEHVWRLKTIYCTQVPGRCELDFICMKVQVTWKRNNWIFNINMKPARSRFTLCVLTFVISNLNPRLIFYQYPIYYTVTSWEKWEIRHTCHTSPVLLAELIWLITLQFDVSVRSCSCMKQQSSFTKKGLEVW